MTGVGTMSKKKPIALLTSCSVTRNYPPIVRIEDAPVCRTMDELCDWWVDKMTQDSKDSRSPGELYAGTGFTAITEIAQDVGHENVFIVTGGTGLARYTSGILPYDFTADKKAMHNAHQHITGEKFLPHVWWAKINRKLNGTPTPVKDLLDEYDVVVGALPKMFTKYILADLEACSPIGRERIFIPITRSMYNGVPSIVRDAYVPYTPEYLSNIMYSRGDKAQRVVQKFLRGASDGDFTGLAAAMIEDAAKGAPQERVQVHYDQMFTEQPSILEAPDVHTAIFRAKGFGYKIGGSAKFAGAWRSATGHLEVKTTAKDKKAGVEALRGVISKMDHISDDNVILERLGAFVEAAKEIDPHLVFTAKEVVIWAQKMYPDDLRGSDNTNKVSYLMSYNAGYLGLEELNVGSRKGFRLV